MKVYEDKQKGVQFKYINISSCFNFGNSIYLKIFDVVDSNGNVHNAVNVITGESIGLSSDDIVFEVKAYLVWKRIV